MELYPGEGHHRRAHCQGRLGVVSHCYDPDSWSYVQCDAVTNERFNICNSCCVAQRITDTDTRPSSFSRLMLPVTYTVGVSPQQYNG